MSELVTMMLISSAISCFVMRSDSSKQCRREHAARLVPGRLTDRTPICQACFHRVANASSRAASMAVKLEIKEVLVSI